VVVTLNCGKDDINDIAWHPGMKWLLVALEGSVQLWSTMDWKLADNRTKLSFESVAWCPNGKLFAGGKGYLTIMASR
jgi:WD40 repeat protein